jgi:glycosyltransferase involved in cell wall biosynthesis
MEMFAKDSDYAWRTVMTEAETFVRHTVVLAESAPARRHRSELNRAVCRALDAIRPDVLVVNGWGHLESRLSMTWCRRNHVPMVTLSDSVRENLPRHWWKEAYKKWLLRGIQAGFAAGTSQARYLEYLGIPRTGIFHPGSCVVDNEYFAKKTDVARNAFRETRIRYGLPERYFLVVARFLDWKNIPFVVRAYAEYRRARPANPCALVLCGSGPEEALIRRTIRETQARDVHLAGFRQVDELPAFYALATAFILPSAWFECWGLVVNEAMASGLPVLVSRMVGCCEDLVRDGENGFAFDPHDVSALGDYMARIAHSPETAQKMGARSREIVQDHSVKIGAVNLWRSVKCALRKNHNHG